MIDTLKNNLRNEISAIEKLWQSVQNVSFGKSPEELEKALQIVKRQMRQFQEVHAQFHAICKAAPSELKILPWKLFLKRLPKEIGEEFESLCKRREDEIVRVKTAISQRYNLLGYHIQSIGKLMEILNPGADTYNVQGHTGKLPRSIAVNHHG